MTSTWKVELISKEEGKFKFYNGKSEYVSIVTDMKDRKANVTFEKHFKNIQEVRKVIEMLYDFLPYNDFQLSYHQNEFHEKLKEVFPEQPGNDSVVYLNSIVFEDSAGIKIDANVKSNKYDCYIKYLEELNEHLAYSVHSARRQGAGLL